MSFRGSVNSLNELTFTCATANESWSSLTRNVVRVRMEPGGATFNRMLRWTVIKTWARGNQCGGGDVDGHDTGSAGERAEDAHFA